MTNTIVTLSLISRQEDMYGFRTLEFRTRDLAKIQILLHRTINQCIPMSIFYFMVVKVSLYQNLYNVLDV